MTTNETAESSPALWPDPEADPLNIGWTMAWKLMADNLAEALQGLTVHFGDNQAQAARAALEAHEDFTSYDSCHGTGAQSGEGVQR